MRAIFRFVAVLAFVCAATQAFAVNALNQYISVTRPDGTVATLHYDASGNLTSDGIWTFTYDPENRLMSATSASVTAVYAYDPLGHRTSKTVNGVKTIFLYEGDMLIAEYDGSGNLLRRYIPGAGADEPIAMVPQTGAKTFFHQDKLGSVVAMSDGSGNLAEGPYTYDPYGRPCGAAGSNCGTASSGGVPLRFAGMYYDAETGLYYARARYYSPDLGRFLQTDPVGYQDDVNGYTYAGNDPTDLTDPTGEDQVWCDANGNCRIVRDNSGATTFYFEHRVTNADGSIESHWISQTKSNFDNSDGHFDQQKLTSWLKALAAATPAPALKGDPYHPDSVDARTKRPQYESNPAHGGTNPNKTLEPADAARAYQDAVRGQNMSTWFARGEKGIYRYFSDNAGHAHFSGIIPENEVPAGVLRQLK